MGFTVEKPFRTPEDYLRLEERGEIRHEYVDGEVYAMSGASRRHNTIAINATLRLRAQARGSGCVAYTSDVKVFVAAQNSFYYPDAMLACGEDDDHSHYVTRPCIIVEVLSPATATVDRREKLMAYRKLESLMAYVLVESDRRHVDFYLRSAEGTWRGGSLGMNDILNVTCAGRSIALCLDDLYEEVAI